MSEKRTSDESEVFQQEDNAKRARLFSPSDTTLQDLPVELLERILVQVVPMEVKDMRMAKSVWKAKVGVVINRLEVVSSQWSSVLTTDVFRNEVNRILDESAQEQTRLDMIWQSPMPLAVIDLTTIKEEIFVLCRSSGPGQDCLVNVYNRNNMKKVKNVILLPEIRARSIAGCSISSCLYVLRDESNCRSVLRITEDEEHQFNISPWISDLALCNSTMFASPNGSLILSSQHDPDPAAISIYNANGSLQQKTVLSEDIYGRRHVYNVMQNSNGNLVLLTINCNIKSELLEIDMINGGIIVRQRQPATFSWSEVSFMDVYDRIFLLFRKDRIELFDSEFNSLKLTGPRVYKGQDIDPKRWHYNSETNEIVSIVKDDKFENGYLTIFRFTEE